MRRAHECTKSRALLAEQTSLSIVLPLLFDQLRPFALRLRLCLLCRLPLKLCLGACCLLLGLCRCSTLPIVALLPLARSVLLLRNDRFPAFCGHRSFRFRLGLRPGASSLALLLQATKPAVAILAAPLRLGVPTEAAAEPAAAPPAA